MQNSQQIDTLTNFIENSKNIVFFGGAGVSTESGIPDFRSVDGLYNLSYDYPPETIISHSFFKKNPQEFYRFYREKILLTALPNTTHKVLAALEEEGRLSAVVTQNIDGLHQAAGSKNVYELHGSVLRNFCTKCNAFYPMEFIQETGKEDVRALPLCLKCHSLVKPDVVLYEEGLDQDVCDNAVKAIQEADMLIVAGTSLKVYPAAGFVDLYKGKKLVLINKEATPLNARADLVILGSLGSVLTAFLERTKILAIKEKIC